MEEQQNISSEQQFVSTELLRAKIRNYSREHREKLRTTATDALRFGLGEIQANVHELDNLTTKDVCGLATRIKRRKHATVEDMYRLSHAFLQDIQNIRAFSKVPGAIQVLVKELTGKDCARQLGAAECFCNLSLGEAPVCEKIASMTGTYLITYFDTADEQLTRSCLWTLANILATSVKGAQTLIHMELVHKLWTLYATDEGTLFDFREDAAICLQIIALQSKQLLRLEDRTYITENLDKKNPTCEAGEYHLQLLFHCDILKTETVLNEQQLLYLINYALSNLYHTELFDSVADRLRIIYAVRILANLLAIAPNSYHKIVQQLTHVRQSTLNALLNKLFSFCNASLTQETLWLVKNIMLQRCDSDFIRSLKVCGTELKLYQ